MSLPLTKMLPLKRVFYGSLRMSGAFRIARQLNRHKALILTYHGVVRSASDVYLHRICIDAGIFEQQMEWLRRNYSVLSLSSLLDGLEGKSSLPPFSVAITFDDGFKNNYSVAFPILKKYGLPATIFLATSYIGEHGKLWTDYVDSLVVCSQKHFLHLPRNGRLVKFNVSSKSLRTRS